MASGPGPTKAGRVAEFLRRLRDVPSAADRDEAFRQVADILIAVEDEMTSFPYDDAYPDDGRMYPAREDGRRSVPGRPDVVRYRHKGHSTLIGDNGAIELLDHRTGDVVFAKAGADGRTIADGGRP